jgi:hypothetical protein
MDGTRTDAEGTDQNTEDICVARLLDRRVAPHEESVRAGGLEAR